MSEQRSGFTLVFYYVPEDKDELSTPNAFAVPKAQDEITLQDIEDVFPLTGEFFFRFKYKYNNASVWLDLSNRTCKVPKCDGKIIMKVTRKVPKDIMFKEDKEEEAPEVRN
jgi:hypothetical protein